MSKKNSDSIQNQINEHTTAITVMAKDLEYIKESVDELNESIKSLKSDIKDVYVTKQELDPIKKIVYSAVSVILLAFVGAVVALVIK